MLLGYNTNGFAHHRLEDALIILSELGYGGVALTLDYCALDPFDPALARQTGVIRGLLQGLGLRSVVETGARFLLDPRRKHQPTLLSAAASARHQRLDFLQRAVDIAQELHADAVSFWSGAADDEAGADVLMDRLVEGCRALCSFAEARQVRLAFEPEPGMFIDSMARYAELFNRVDHPLFGLTIDIGHLHCQGETPIAAVLKRWQDVLWNVHIEDMRRGVHEHLMFGEGEIDFREVFAALEDIGYVGGLYVELSRHSHNAVETAAQALRFLREQVGDRLDI